MIERLRIEETKALLARAKEGMEKEAERLAAEKEKKEAARMAGGGESGGTWVPSHLRSSVGSLGGARFGGGSSIRGAASMDGATGIRRAVDVANEDLFPDLAEAEKILAAKEQQEKNQKKPVVGGARQVGQRQPLNLAPRSMAVEEGVPQRKPLNLAPPSSRKTEEASGAEDTRGGEEVPQRKPLNLAPPSSKYIEETSIATVAPSETPKEAKTETEPTKSTATLAPAPSTVSTAPGTVVTEASPVTLETSAAAQAPVAAAPEKKVLKKKKKKDLSTFKPSSSSS